MKVAIILLFVTCAFSVTVSAQPPVSTGSGWAFTCKNGVPVYDGSGTPPAANGSCKSAGTGSSSTGSQGEILQGAFNAGVAVNQWLANIERQGRERRAARERARVAAEIARRDQFVRDSIAAAAAREATWQRLSSQLRLSAAPDLQMRLGSPATEIGFRFDGDTEQKDLSYSELMARDQTNCTFIACGKKTEMADLGDPMVVDLRHLRRAAHLLQQTEYAPGDERESALDVAMDIIDGGGPEFDVPPDAPELPSDAARDVGAAVAERKAATAERVQRAAAVDSVAQKSEFLSDVEELARGDQTLSDVERAQLLGELARQRRAIDSAFAQARQDHQRAEESERQAVARTRSTLYRVARFQGREPGPATRRSRGAPRWNLASASELTVEIKGEVSVYAAEPLVDNPDPRLPPQVEVAVRQRLTPDVLYVTGETGSITVPASVIHQLEVRRNTRVAVDEVPLSTDTPDRRKPVSLELIRGSIRWWRTVLDPDGERARLIERLRSEDWEERGAARDELRRIFGLKPSFRVRRASAYGGGVIGSDVEFFASPNQPDVVRVNSGIVILEVYGSKEEVILVGGETATISDRGVSVVRHPPAK